MPFEKLTKIRSLREAELDARVDEAVSQGTVRMDAVTRAHKLRVLHQSIAALLAGWPLEDVEEAAWVFALDGWQGVPPLSADYDTAFHAHLLPLIEGYRQSDQASGLPAVIMLFEELRNRVQFLQTRAADIRLSAQIERLTDASIARVEPCLDELLRILRTSSPETELRDFERSAKASLIVALANHVGRLSPEAGAALAAMRNERVFEKLKFAADLASGVAGNLLTDKVNELLRFMARYH